MIIGVISDTHDKLSALQAAFSFFLHEHVDHVIHCGDWKSLSTLEYFIKLTSESALPVSAVLGNNDHDSEPMMHLADEAPHFTLREGVYELALDGKHCAIYHSHHAPTLRNVRSNSTYDVAFLGHTHKPRIEMKDETLIINPGSTAFSIPRSKAFSPTVALLDTQTMKATLHTLPVAHA